MFSGGNQWSSTSSVTGNTQAYHSNPHDFEYDGVYSLYVTLSRSSTGQSAVFSGADFRVPPVP